MPGEVFFTKNLQNNMTFNLGSKTIRKGRLIIFKRSHFFIQFFLLSAKGGQETFEIPMPFKSEYHKEENLMYFDYRVKSLTSNEDGDEVKDLIFQQTIKNSPSQYYNKILEIQTY